MSIIPLHIRSVIILCRHDGVLVFIHMYHAHVSLVDQWKQHMFVRGSDQNENK